MGNSSPQVGDLVSRDGIFYGVKELQTSADGDVVVAEPTAEGAPHTRLFIKAANLKPAGKIADFAIWGD